MKASVKLGFVVIYVLIGVQLKPSCEKQVRRVMRQRAIRADLIPEVEEMCLEDLSALCTEKVGPGQEILCLQDNYSR